MPRSASDKSEQLSIHVPFLVGESLPYRAVLSRSGAHLHFTETSHRKSNGRTTGGIVLLIIFAWIGVMALVAGPLGVRPPVSGLSVVVIALANLGLGCWLVVDGIASKRFAIRLTFDTRNGRVRIESRIGISGRALLEEALPRNLTISVHRASSHGLWSGYLVRACVNNTFVTLACVEPESEAAAIAVATQRAIPGSRLEEGPHIVGAAYGVM